MISEKTYFEKDVDGRIKISNVKNFDISKIFDCGQCFRFEPVQNSIHEAEFSGVAFGRFVSVAQDGDTVYVYNSSLSDFENIWYRFLALDVDYDAVAEEIASASSNPALRRAIEYGKGISHRVGDAIQPSHPLSSPSPPARNLSQHQGLFQ